MQAAACLKGDAMSDALIVVDVQNDFLPGGALAVANGDSIIPAVNDLIDRAPYVVLTQDWHPEGHVSFAQSHPGHQLYDVIDVPSGKQVLWPVHCVQGTQGAEISRLINAVKAGAIVRKGAKQSVDSYSGFVDADGKTRSGLAGLLRERGVTRVFVCGLATDFCVSWTALDAVAAGFDTYVVTDASGAIDVNGSLSAARQAWQKCGVKEIRAADVRFE
jgi:nicotinamidase/pyrazinamidase